MKICIVSTLPPYHSGVSEYTTGLIHGFEIAEPDHELYFLVNNSAQLSLNRPKLKIMKIWNKGPIFFFQLLMAIISIKPNVVHFQHEFSLYGGVDAALLFPLLLMVTRLIGIKNVVTIHGVISRRINFDKFTTGFLVVNSLTAIKYGLPIITFFICHVANIVIVHNDFLKDILVREYHITTDKIVVIRHGIGDIDVDRMNYSNDNVILFFGNIAPNKGLEVLLEAFEKINIPYVKLILAGSPHPRGREYFNSIKKRINESSKAKKIILTGYIRNSEIKSYFEEATVAVFPYTITVSSSGGLSFALQYKTPVVVTSLPSFTEIIIDGFTGLVVPPENVEALKEALERILKNKQLQLDMSKNIAKSYANLQWPAIAQNTILCYSGKCD